MCRRPIFRSSFLLLVLLFATVGRASPWVADQGNGTYRNPTLFADYSDPDLIRVGTDFYLIASSFNAVPGLPILHSKDLVNWELIGHVYAAQPPLDVYGKPQHGSGSWAPALRYHNGEFYIFYGRLWFSARVCHRRAGRTSQSLGRTQPAAAEIPRAAFYSDCENDIDSTHSGGSGRTGHHGSRLRSGHPEKRRQRFIAFRNNLQWSGQGAPEVESPPIELSSNTVYLRASVADNALTRFAYSVDGTNFTDVGTPFTARQGRWIGAKVGLHALGTVPVSEYGFADIDWFRIE